jgi:hypothetical protein
MGDPRGPPSRARRR